MGAEGCQPVTAGPAVESPAGGPRDVDGQSHPGSSVSATLVRRLGGWAGIVPYAVFVAIFLIIPVGANIWSSIREDGKFSFGPLSQLGQAQYVNAFKTSILLSLLTAILGGILGLLLGWAIATAERPRWLRDVVQSFSAVASQSGGVALAFAFIAALGTQGLITQQIEHIFGWNIDGTLKLTSFLGLALVYLYFQIPLMAILMIPSLEGIKEEWNEAAQSLGATRSQYLRQIVTPIIMPSIAGALIVLFANSFSAYATAYALTGGGVNLVPVLVGFYISGNVVTDNSLAAALVTGMMVIVVISMLLRSLILRRSTRWLR